MCVPVCVFACGVCVPVVRVRVCVSACVCLRRWKVKMEGGKPLKWGMPRSSSSSESGEKKALPQNLLAVNQGTGFRVCRYIGGGCIV